MSEPTTQPEDDGCATGDSDDTWPEPALRFRYDNPTVTEYPAMVSVTHSGDTTVRPAWPGKPPELTPGPDGGIGILAAMVKAMAEVGAVGKSRVHSGDRTGTWAYRSGDDVMTAAQPALVAAGVLPFPTVESTRTVDLVGGSGSTTKATEVRLTVRFFCAEDGSSLATTVIAHGIGATTYAIGACYSYSLKYVLTMALVIPFDDPRMDAEDPISGQDGDRRPSNDVGNGVTVSSGTPPSAPAESTWWSREGWASEEEHADARAALIDRMKALGGETRAAVNTALGKLLASETDPSATVYQTVGRGRKGTLNAVLAKAAVDRAFAAIDQLDPPPAPDSEDPETEEQTGPAPAPAAEELPRAEPSEDAPWSALGGAAGMPIEDARSMIEDTFLKLDTATAARVEQELEDAGLWPIAGLVGGEVDQAADLVADILGL